MGRFIHTFIDFPMKSKHLIFSLGEHIQNNYVKRLKKCQRTIQVPGEREVRIGKESETRSSQNGASETVCSHYICQSEVNTDAETPRLLLFLSWDTFNDQVNV